MSTLGDARARLLTGLEAAQIRTATTAKLSAPAVLVEPGDPWTEHVTLSAGRRRVSRWQLTLVVGKADSEGAFAALAELADRIDAALKVLDGVQLPAWSAPHDYTIDGVPYPSAVATITVATA